ncbi:hypothetical protein DFP72DRAFT_743768, partial [Ephemerocybe angulata]
YQLKAVIYSGGYHFAARFIDSSGSTWVYDGQHHRGYMREEERTSPGNIDTLETRQANVFMYA